MQVGMVFGYLDRSLYPARPRTEQVDADSMGMMKHIIRMRGNHKEDRCCDVLGATVFKCAQCIVGDTSLRVINTFRLDPTIRCKTRAWPRLLH